MNEITDVQQARAIIGKVGKPYQKYVIAKLRSQSANNYSWDEEWKAEQVISNMESEYALNVANVLWKDKFDEIPDYIKAWVSERKAVQGNENI